MSAARTRSARFATHGALALAAVLAACAGDPVPAGPGLDASPVGDSVEANVGAANASDEDPWQPSADLLAREARIDRELERLAAAGAADGGAAWAGTYRCGDGLGVNLTVKLAPGSGFVFTHFGCLGLYGQAHGTARVLNDGRLALACTAGELDGVFAFPEYVPVRWGSLRFLVAPEELDDFLAEARAGDFEDPARFGPRGGYLLEESTREDSLTGEPELPAAWADRRTAESDER